MGISIQQYRISIGMFDVCKSRCRISNSSMTRLSDRGVSTFPRYQNIMLFVLYFALLMYSSNVHCIGTFNGQSGKSAYLSSVKTYTPGSCQIINHNFIAKITYGNRNKNGIKICHWNAGGGFLINKQAEINNVVNNIRPHVFGITESSFKKTHIKEDVEIQDYTLFFSNTLENPHLKISRSCAYVHKDLTFSLRDDLMSDKFSSVWVELGKPRQKKILVCIVYRDWQYVNQPDESSNTIAAQFERWCSFLEQWEKAISSDREIIVTGDMNLNFLNWCDDNLPSTSQTYKLRSFVSELFTRIMPHGFVQLVTVATRAVNGQEPSGLDHLYSNFPEKMSEIQVNFHGSPDHNLIWGTRFTRSVVSKPRMLRKRSYKNFNSKLYKEAVGNLSWWDVYCCENVNDAVHKTYEKLSSILNKMAPIKNIQVRKMYAPWMSQLTKDKIKERDLAQKRAASTQCSIDWLYYRSLRNQINKSLKIEKKQWQRNKLEGFGKDSRTAWKNLKNWLGWSAAGPPTKLLDRGILYSKPKILAKIINEFFINKVKLLRSKIPVTLGNPISLVQKIMEN